MTPVIEALRGISVLEGLSDEHIEQLATIGECVEFPANALIFREGDHATDVYFVVEGDVALEICARSHGCRRILTINAGELLGWSPVLEQTRLTATARTLTPTHAVKINGRQILALCEHDSRFGYEFMRRAALALAKRLSATRLQLLDVYGKEMPRVLEENDSPDADRQEPS